jgi:hypothetical protein
MRQASSCRLLRPTPYPLIITPCSEIITHCIPHSSHTTAASPTAVMTKKYGRAIQTMRR